jgi:hypothetical protein
MKKITIPALFALGLFGGTTAHAVSFDLLAPNATIVLSSNTTSTFFEVAGNGTESGTAASLYSATLGGNEDTGFWVKISFDGNPQPVLTSAFLKASNDYLWWDATDLAAFNSGSFDSITLWNSGSAGQGLGHYTGNPTNPQWKFYGTSHAGINGTPGESTIPGVPDGGSTLALLGLALSAFAFFHRKNAR